MNQLVVRTRRAHGGGERLAPDANLEGLLYGQGVLGTKIILAFYAHQPGARSHLTHYSFSPPLPEFLAGFMYTSTDFMTGVWDTLHSLSRAISTFASGMYAAAH